jgi:hypothetical protein
MSDDCSYLAGPALNCFGQTSTTDQPGHSEAVNSGKGVNVWC